MLGEPGDWSQMLRWRRGASKDQRRDTQLPDGSGEPAEQAETEFRGAGACSRAEKLGKSRRESCQAGGVHSNSGKDCLFFLILFALFFCFIVAAVYLFSDFPDLIL